METEAASTETKRPLRREHVPRDKPKIRWTLREPPHEPRIPKRSVRHKNNGSATFCREAFLFAPLDTVKHLHFKIRLRESFLRCQLRKPADHRHVVRRKSHSYASLLFLGP